MNSKLICWDSSVVIDWILDKKSKNPERIPGILSVWKNVGDDDCRLAVSTLVYTEVLESTMPAGAMEKFRAFMGSRKNVKIIPVDIRIAKQAQEIRSRASKKIEAPDAVHLATAVVLRARVFHTFDKDLLSLDGKDVVNRLSITRCA